MPSLRHSLCSLAAIVACTAAVACGEAPERASADPASAPSTTRHQALTDLEATRFEQIEGDVTVVCMSDAADACPPDGRTLILHLERDDRGTGKQGPTRPAGVDGRDLDGNPVPFPLDVERGATHKK